MEAEYKYISGRSYEKVMALVNGATKDDWRLKQVDMKVPPGGTKLKVTAILERERRGDNGTH